MHKQTSLSIHRHIPSAFEFIKSSSLANFFYNIIVYKFAVPSDPSVPQYFFNRSAMAHLLQTNRYLLIPAKLPTMSLINVPSIDILRKHHASFPFFFGLPHLVSLYSPYSQIHHCQKRHKHTFSVIITNFFEHIFQALNHLVLARKADSSSTFSYTFDIRNNQLSCKSVSITGGIHIF